MPDDEYSVPLWLVTHVDLHRTVKVQTLLVRLKEVVSGLTTFVS